jgi:hypothetical protein
MMKRWKQHFQELLGNTEGEINSNIIKMTQIGIEQENKEIEEIRNENEYKTIDDVKNAIKRVRNNRSPGPDNIIAELLKINQVY